MSGTSGQQPRVRSERLRSYLAEPAEQGTFCQEDQGHTEFKIPMSRFVVKIPHAQCAAQSTAQQSGSEQSGFRNAPGIPDCSFLIHTHECETDYIDNCNIE